MGLLETAAAALIGGERRIETSARNITNINTPGYKRHVSFTQAINSGDLQAQPVLATPTTQSMVLQSQGALFETGNPFDLAVNGQAFLLLRDGNRFVLSRGGQFSPGIGGTLVDAMGRVLQQAGGGDVEMAGNQPTILSDGTLLEGEVPLATIALYQAGNIATDKPLSAEQASELVEDEASELKQGMLERSNVTLSDEMIELMRTQRQFESGAQMVRTYDQLMSQAISTFSRGGS